MSIPTKLTQAAIAGFGATLPMTVAMLAMRELLPPQEQYALPPGLITEQVEAAVGLDDDIGHPEHRILTLISHFGYGAAAGMGYAPFAPEHGGSPVLRGATYGLVVWASSYLGWLPALNILTPATEHPPARNTLMIAAHLVWGAALGTLLHRFQHH